MGGAMTGDDIIRMAYEASDGVLSYDAEGRWILSEQEVIQLAALVAAAEREACAKVCDELRDEDGFEPYGTECAAAIRARGSE